MCARELIDQELADDLSGDGQRTTDEYQTTGKQS
jgi:hypothetical protein